jgi:hypothetical protein
MDTPRGLRRPHHVAELVPPLLVLAGVATAAFYAFLHLSQMGWPGLP